MKFPLVRLARLAAKRVSSGPSSLQRVDEAVAEVVAQIDDVAVGDFAVRLGQPDIALGVQALGLLVVDDPIRLERRAAIVDLHIADGGDALIAVVVIDLVGAHEHLIFGILALHRLHEATAGLHGRLRPRREIDHLALLRERRRGRQQGAPGD